MAAAAYALVPVGLVALCFWLVIEVLLRLRAWRRRGRRSPLTSKLLRGPGNTLRNEIDDASGDIAAYLSTLLSFPLSVLGIHLSQSYLAGTPESTLRVSISVLVVLGGIAFLAYRLHGSSHRRFQLQCALDAEIAVAQELDQLMRQGAITFHDFPAEQFNIDHVVVTRGGVFAVETKSRLKPDRGGGAEDAKVIFDGHALLFPGWHDTTTLEQARRQAVWLGRWLSRAVGSPVEVRPVVALPGWYVERQAKSDVRVISGREAKSLLSGWRGDLLSDETITRIAHQLEERCRNVEPVQFGRARKIGRLVPGRA